MPRLLHANVHTKLLPAPTTCGEQKAVLEVATRDKRSQFIRDDGATHHATLTVIAQPW